MLTALTFRDFKSFANQTARLAPATMLLGANASGKSNLLDAIRFLQGLSLGLPVPDVLRGRWEGGREVWPGLRGGATETARRGAPTFSISSDWEVEGLQLQHSVTCSLSPEPVVDRESLWLEGKYLFDTHAPTLGTTTGRSPSGALRVATKGTGGGRNPVNEYSSLRSLLVQILAQPPARTDLQVTRAIELLVGALRQASFVDIRPALMRDYAPRAVTTLGSSGENISSVLARLCEDHEKKGQLVDWLSELCAPELVDIDFVRTDIGDVLLVLVERDGTRISARSLSDGTLRFLGELAALQTAPAGAMLLIEEIENGLHPSRVQLLVGLIEHATQSGDRQVIATTHSPLVLQALSRESLGRAVVFARTNEDEGSVVRRLSDLSHFDEVLGRRGIEHLFTTRWLERAV